MREKCIDICRRIGHFKRNTNLCGCILYSLCTMSSKFIDFSINVLGSSANKRVGKCLSDENLKSTS